MANPATTDANGDEPEVPFERTWGCYLPLQLAGLALLQGGAKIEHYGGGVYNVTVNDTEGRTCMVNVRNGSGSCDYYRMTRPRTSCKHYWCVAYQIQPPTKDEFTAPIPVEIKIVKPTVIPVDLTRVSLNALLGGGYKERDAKAYDKALRGEYPAVIRRARAIFQQYAGDTLWKPLNQHGTGRHAFPLWVMLFSDFSRAYNGFSLRKTEGFLHLLVEAGHLDAAPGYAALSQFANSETTTPILDDLISSTAYPLQEYGRFRIAADGTGWSSSRFGDYLREHRNNDKRNIDAPGEIDDGPDEKKTAKKEAREQIWWRVVAVCDVDALCVLGVHVSAEEIGEITAFKRMLPGLVERGWDVEHIALDAGFDATLIRDMLVDVGWEPVIPMRDGRKNAIPRKHRKTVKHPEELERLFHFFSMQNAEFKKLYSPRWKAECLFSSIERVFGKYTRSISETSARNDILMTFIAHNMRVLHIGESIIASMKNGAA